MNDDAKLLAKDMVLYPDVDSKGCHHPEAEKLRDKWIASIQTLRRGKRGYAMDAKVQPLPQGPRPLLHGYVAIPPLENHVAPPDEQVMPSTKVVAWNKKQK